MRRPFRRKWSPIGKYWRGICTWCGISRDLRGDPTSGDGHWWVWWCRKCDEAEAGSISGLESLMSLPTTEQSSADEEDGNEPDAPSTTTEPQARQRIKVSTCLSVLPATSPPRPSV